MVFDKKHYSLTVGEPLRLTYDDSIILESNNENVLVKDGMVFAPRDFRRPDGQAIITAKTQSGALLDTCTITIVIWKSNSLELETTEIGTYKVLIENNGTLYGFIGRNLYSTTDGFVTRNNEGIANISVGQYPILCTPYGYFARDSSPNGTIYKSKDLLNWNLCFTPALKGLYHSFDFYFDELNGNLYIYVGEYSADGLESNRNHKVYRGVIDSEGLETWETVYSFYSIIEYNENSNNSPSARHIHVVTVDKRTGDVWVNTGDGIPQCHWIISQNNGDTWRVIGSGVGLTDVESQEWRSLSVWFTDDYIYWNMDTSVPQYIFRLKRADLPNQTPDNDLRERIALLNNGSMWYHIYAQDKDGYDIVLMAQSAEGQRRDWLTRLFYIKEFPNGEVDIREVLNSESNTPGKYVGMNMFEPILQDKNGYIYLNGRSTSFTGTLRCKLVKKYRPLKYKWIEPVFI